ncbi:hypothetical protein [Ekhidna sp. To15]|uniref:hypothetical protein n=1 Tax=Ekhidna sp. To15 TaxID=3395267 RepID=UPI003F527BE8
MKNKFKSGLLTLGVISIILISSCSSDAETSPSFSFIDQNLQGTIDGISFTSKGGFYSEFSQEEEILMRIYDSTESGEICDISSNESVLVSVMLSKKVGVYDLSFNVSPPDAITVNLVNPNSGDGFPSNSIAMVGAVEILTVSETEVTGRMDATFDIGNTVNGNFTVISCN